MNQYEREQVDKICEAWLRSQMGETVEDVAREGKNMLGEKGVFGGGEKPDVMGPKIDKCRKQLREEMEFAEHAERIFEELDVTQRWVLTARLFNVKMNKKNRVGNPLLKPRELAEYVGLTYDQYRDRLRNARAIVLRIDKQVRPYVYDKPEVRTNAGSQKYAGE